MKTTSELILATYNIQFSLHPEELEKSISHMVKMGVSLFCLQEVVSYPDSDFIVKRLLKQLGNHWKAMYNLGEEKSVLGMGNCIMWNTQVLTLEKQHNELLPYSKSLAIHEKIFSSLAGGITVPFKRRAVIGEFKFNKKLMRISNVHLDQNGGTKNRTKQLTYLMKILSTKNSVDHEVICGDFNCFDLRKTGHEIDMYKKILGSDYRDASSKIGWTADLYDIDTSTGALWFEDIIKRLNLHVKRKLDYIWVKNISVNKCEKLPLGGSDHAPVVVYLSV